MKYKKKYLIFLILILSIYSINAFQVLGTPLENFDVNTTTGMVKYRPLNNTFFISNRNGQHFISIPDHAMSFYRNGIFCMWVNISGKFKGKDPSPPNPTFPAFLIYPETWSTPHNGYTALYFSNSTTLVLEIANSTGYAFNTTWNRGIEFNDSEWHHICTYHKNDGNTSIIYDGEMVSSDLETPVDSVSVNQILYIPDQGTTKANMEIDEIRIYCGQGQATCEIMPSNIKEIYNSGRTPNASLNSTKLNDWITFNENPYLSKIYGSNVFYNRVIPQIVLTNNYQVVISSEINVTTLSYEVNISIVNITNALIFWKNYTLINNSKTGNQTWKFLNNDTFYILDNFNLTEGITRTYSPIWFSSSTSTSKHIASNLTNNVNITVRFNVDSCSLIKTITYRSNTGVQTASLNGIDYCSNNLVTIGNVLIEPAASSNEFDISYNNQALTDTCNNFFGAGESFITFAILFIIVACAGFVIYMLMGEGSEIDLTTIAGICLVAFVVLILGMKIINSIGGC